MATHFEHQIEAVIFASEKPVKAVELLQLFENQFPDSEFTMEQLKEAIGNIQERMKQADLAFELREIGGGFQFLTRPEYHLTVSNFLNLKSNRSLSQAALETLSIIAYKEPITKSEIEDIRGVNCDYTIQKLLEKDLIEIAGKKEAPGKPLLYRVSQSFLDYFGINSTGDLPKPKEVIPDDDNSIGQAQDSELEYSQQEEENVPSKDEEE